MIHHVSVDVSELETSGRFYDAVLGSLGWRRHIDNPDVVAWGIVRPVFFASAGRSAGRRRRARLLRRQRDPGGQGRLGGRRRRRRDRRRGARATARVRWQLLLGVPARPGRPPGRDRRTEQLTNELEGERAMAKVKVGINGFGRIGRNLFRAAYEAGRRARVRRGQRRLRRRLARPPAQVRLHLRSLRRRGRGRRRARSPSTAPRSRCSPSATPPTCRGATSASTS